MPLICYLIVLVVSMVIVIVVYTLAVFGWCGAGPPLPPPRSARAPEAASLSLSPYLASKFQHRQGIEKGEIGSKSECVVSLSGFKDGENVCQLPCCKHSLHSSCIDMWLYSHSDCPVCRAPVDSMNSPNLKL